MLPLTGVRILAFEQYGAGPFGTQYLADLGAEVIKVEQAGTGGDYARDLGPYFIGGEKTDTASSLAFQSWNRNKKSITLDLNSEKGRAVLDKRVASADATADNLRGDVPERLGLVYDALKHANPAIVCAHCSAYGRTGSRRDWPGYDYPMQAENGYFYLCGEPDSPPTRFGLSIVDYMGGMSMALGLVSAVLGARQTGIGRDVDVSLFNTAAFNLNYVANWALNSDYEPTRIARSAHPSMVPTQLYKTKDNWIFLMLNKPTFWPVLCEIMDRPDLAADPRFETLDGRLKHRDLLTEVLDAALSTRTTAEWIKACAGRVPAAPVLTPREALENPFLEERKAIQTLKHQSGTEFRMLAPPIDTGDDRTNDRGAPLLGEHTEEVLATVGLSPNEIASLRETGVI